MNEQEKKPSNPSLYPDPMRGAEQSFSNQTPWELETGATLRDYFANSAMQVILKHRLSKEMTMCREAFETHITQQSYDVADAMLKQREL
jgi:hypothetical protein